MQIVKDLKQQLLSQQTVRNWLHELGIRPMSHSTLLWFREDPTCHTRVTMRNYFSLNYGIPNPEYTFALHDSDGTRLVSWVHTARPDETIVVDSAVVCRKFSLGHRFEGTLIAEVQNRRLDPPRFLRANVDYYNEAGMITTVHDQGRLARTPRRDAQSLVYVRHDSEFETGIVLQNWYRFRRSPREYFAEAEIELLNSAGAKRTAAAPRIPGCASRYVSLAELFPDAIDFLGGRVGGLRIRSNIAMGRSIPVVRSRTTGFSAVSHTVGDHDPQVYQRDVVKAATPDDRWAPVWCSFVAETDDVRTEYSIFNNWVPVATYNVDLRISDAAGVLRAKLPGALQLKPDETKVLRMREVLRSAGVNLPFHGTVEARLVAVDNQEVMPGPGMLQMNTVWTSGGALTQSNNQSLGHLNTTFTDAHYLSPRRTKMFGRVISNQDHDTMLSLMNPSSDELYDRASKTEVTVNDASGTRKQSVSLTIPPHGSVWVSLDELFPNLSDFLSESHGVSSILVIDPTVKLTGYLGVRHRATGATGIDHLFGG